MTRSNVSRIIFAVFCGLATQFYGGSANAQDVVLYQGTQWSLGSGACTGNGYCVYLWNGGIYQGTLQLFDPWGNRLWMSPGNCAFLCNENLNFQSDGNVVVYDFPGGAYGDVNWATNTYAGGPGTSTGYPGGVMVLDESGNFQLFDIYWNWIGCFYCSGYSTYGAQN
jgi:hypothetical protein